MKKRTGKRFFTVCLAVSAVMAAAIPAYASEEDEKSMELTMSKASEYIMTIPKDQDTVTFGTEKTQIGSLSVTGDIGTKQKVLVTVAKTNFVDVKDDTNFFAFDLQANGQNFSWAEWNWEQVRAQEPVAYPLTVYIPSETWADTVAGTYGATITFTAQLQDIE